MGERLRGWGVMLAMAYGMTAFMCVTDVRANPAKPVKKQAAPAGSPDVTIVNPTDGSVLVAIPGGTFTMGSDDGDGHPKPPHRVALQPYYIGCTPVTNAQFRRFVESTRYKSVGEREQYAKQWGDQASVVCVSWHDAVAYCKWAGLRLPTEAEWEFAARGTDGRRYPWGDEWDPTRCCNSADTMTRRAVPVGSFPNGASPFGCLDMAGNVWQWCSSLYKDYPYSSTDGRESLEAEGNRATRGGSFINVIPSTFSSAYRNNSSPEWKDFSLGFRVARSAP